MILNVFRETLNLTRVSLKNNFEINPDKKVSSTSVSWYVSGEKKKGGGGQMPLCHLLLTPLLFKLCTRKTTK